MELGFIEDFSLSKLLALSKKEIISCEALARWKDPERGLIPPGHFIDILEEHKARSAEKPVSELTDEDMLRKAAELREKMRK